MTTFTIHFICDGEKQVQEITTKSEEFFEEFLAWVNGDGVDCVQLVSANRDDIIVCPKCKKAKGIRAQIEKACWGCAEQTPRYHGLEQYTVLGEVFTMRQFREAIEAGAVGDDDGNAYFGNEKGWSPDNPARVSTFLEREAMPVGFDRIIWFNK